MKYINTKSKQANNKNNYTYINTKCEMSKKNKIVEVELI